MDKDTISKHRYRFLVVAIFLVQVLLVALACPIDIVLGLEPYGGSDYQTHYQQTSTVGQALSKFGKTWAYDPNMLAGFPTGLFFDVDNKAHCLLTHALTRLGIRQAAAFNLFTVLSCLICPLFILLAARLLRLRREACLVAMALGVLLWSFDSGPRFAWGVGMVSFATTSHFCVLILALFYRLMEQDNGEPGWRFFVPLVLLLPLSLLIHVWAFAILAVPMTVLYIRRLRVLTGVGHLQVWALVAAALLGNIIWLWPALMRLDLMISSGRLGQTNPLYFISDWLGMVINPLDTGFILQHTFFRYAAFCGAAITIWRWRKHGDQRFFFAMLCMGWLLGLTYVAAMLPGLEETEPYRFIVPTILLTGVFAAPWIAEVLSLGHLRTLSPRAKALVVVLLVLALPRGVREIIYFIPEIWPASHNDPRVPASPEIAFSRRGGAKNTKGPFRMSRLPREFVLLSNYINRNLKKEGRILVQYWPAAEYLRWTTDRPILGGFPDRRTIHEAANIFRHEDDPRFGGKKLADYLVRYNVRYVIMFGSYFPNIESRKNLLHPIKMIGKQRIYLVRHMGNYIMKGSGKVKAGLNRIEVSEARPGHGNPQEMVLRFHHMDGLKCKPGCRVSVQTIEDDPAGFIRVTGQPTLPSRFVVEHVY